MRQETDEGTCTEPQVEMGRASGCRYKSMRLDQLSKRHLKQSVFDRYLNKLAYEQKQRGVKKRRYFLFFVCFMFFILAET